MDLGGTWDAQYTFGDGYESATGTTVAFRLVLVESGLLRWLGRARFTGSAQDDASKGGFPEAGAVTGRRVGRNLEFLKIHPIGYAAGADGKLVPLKQWLIEQWQLADPLAKANAPLELSPHRIAYRGALDDAGMRIAGIWRILPTMIRAGSFEDVIPGEGRGTWTARRA